MTTRAPLNIYAAEPVRFQQVNIVEMSSPFLEGAQVRRCFGTSCSLIDRCSGGLKTQADWVGGKKSNDLWRTQDTTTNPIKIFEHHALNNSIFSRVLASHCESCTFRVVKS